MVDVSERRGTTLSPEASAREQARRQVERKHKLFADAVAYVLINLALVAVWAVTGGGSFWPAWVAGIWGALLLLDVLNVYYRRPVTEEEIQREMRRVR